MFALTVDDTRIPRSRYAAVYMASKHQADRRLSRRYLKIIKILLEAVRFQSRFPHVFLIFLALGSRFAHVLLTCLWSRART